MKTDYEDNGLPLWYAMFIVFSAILSGAGVAFVVLYFVLQHPMNCP